MILVIVNLIDHQNHVHFLLFFTMQFHIGLSALPIDETHLPKNDRPRMLYKVVHCAGCV